MLVGFHLDKYVLIGADTRMTREMKDGTFTFEDGHEKVRETRLGLAAGAGSVELIRPVMDRLSGDECSGAMVIDDVLRIASEEWARVAAKRSKASAYVRGMVHRTSWLFSYANPFEGGFRMRLAGCRPGQDQEMYLCATNDVFLGMPAEGTEDDFRDFEAAARSRLQPFTTWIDLPTSIQHHVNVTAALIRSAAEFFPSVSSNLQIGLHVLGCPVFVSKVLSEGESFQLTLNTSWGQAAEVM